MSDLHLRKSVLNLFAFFVLEDIVAICFKHLYHSTAKWYIQKGRLNGVNAFPESQLSSCTSDPSVVEPHGLLFKD